MNSKINPDKKEKIGLSSYEKGINNILNDVEKFEALIWEYVLRVNSNFYSKEFPSTQITKIILNKLNLEKTKFPIFHKVIRIILSSWQDKGICKLISRSRTSNTKRTKEIYRFNEEGLEKIRAKFINNCIEEIKSNELDNLDIEVLKKREQIIEDLNYKLNDLK
ncbi:MAG: hypothetical protein ACTSXP_12655 [Promethearchaeota archaeon]